VSGKEQDLDRTDDIATRVIEEILTRAPKEILGQLQDNLTWIKEAKEHKLVVGSKARILYADVEGRIAIAKAFNDAIAKGLIGPVVLGRDHHDVSGTDSPYRETANIYDGSRYTADMAIQNVIGDSFRGATWVSIHNGGGVGWGEVINGGFGLLLDGSLETEARLEKMLFFDVMNGISRRSWARNPNAISTLQRIGAKHAEMVVSPPYIVDPEMLSNLLQNQG
jgi:urocanate hydratase